MMHWTRARVAASRTGPLGRTFRRLGPALGPGSWLRGAIFLAGAVATGAVAVALARCGDWALATFRSLASGSIAWRWLAPPVGMALVAAAARHVFRGSEGSGIPQTIAALELRDFTLRSRLLSLRIAAGKLLLTVTGLACGASVGREGPTVQVGASIMHSLAGLRRFPLADVDRGLILAGGAAGVAAAFNTPLAGVVFAMEELSRSLEQRTAGTIWMTVIVAGVTSVALIGNYTYFGTTDVQLAHAGSWLAVPVCGIAGGLAGGLFARLMISCSTGALGFVREFRNRRPVALALGCGLVIAAIGWASGGNTFGTGYAQARELVQTGALGSPLFSLAKGAATLISYVAGIPGGLFSPSLAIGAGLGGELAPWLPATPASAVVLMAMAAYFSGVVQAPLTALVIVGEMSGDHALTLPLMAAALLGRAAGALLCREPLYRALAQPYLDSRKEPAKA